MEQEVDPYILKLKRKRRLNVQEQNTLTQHQIRIAASYHMENSWPAPLLEVIQKKSLSAETSILLSYYDNYFGIEYDFGLMLTEDQVFYEFELLPNSNRTGLLKLLKWEDVSCNFEVKAHKKGIGKTFGYLAVEVMLELNKTKL